MRNGIGDDLRAQETLPSHFAAKVAISVLLNPG